MKSIIGAAILSLAGTLRPPEAHAQLKPCDVEVTDSKPVTGTHWIVQIRGFACGFGIGGAVDIIARHVPDDTIVTLATGGDVWRAKIEITNTQVLIGLPNLSDVAVLNPTIPEITVSFRYDPDRPEERRRYFAWVYNKTDEANRIWFCETIMPRMDSVNRKLNDEVIAYSAYIPHGSRHSYCPAS